MRRRQPVGQAGGATRTPRTGEQLLQIPARHNATAVHDGHPIADALDLGEQVRVQEDRDASIAQPADDRANVVAADGIERRRGLVEQHELRPAQQSDAEPKALLHPLGERTRPRDRRRDRQPDRVQRVGDRVRPARIGEGRELAMEPQHLAGGIHRW